MFIQGKVIITISAMIIDHPNSYPKSNLYPHPTFPPPPTAPPSTPSPCAGGPALTARAAPGDGGGGSYGPGGPPPRLLCKRPYIQNTSSDIQ